MPIPNSTPGTRCDSQLSTHLVSCSIIALSHPPHIDREYVPAVWDSDVAERRAWGTLGVEQSC
jgi:hypothetical protein